MKKGLRGLVFTTITLFILLIGVIVKAEALPVKSAWILSKDCVVVLREDGTLIFADAIDAEEAEFVINDVDDFLGSIHNGYLTGTILYTNGNVANLDGSQYNTEHFEYKIDVVADNAKEIYSLERFLYAYIDNSNTLRGKHRYYDEEDTVIMADVKVCYGSNGDDIYVTTNDDRLYKIDIRNEVKEEIMANVKGVKIANNDLLVLRNNGDLYLCKELEVPSRIGTNIEDMSKVVVEDTWVKFYGIEYVNKNGEYFAGTATSEMKKYLDNVRDVYRYEENKHAITNNGVMYYDINLNRPYERKTNNVEKLIGNTDHFILKNNKLYINNAYVSNKRFVLEDVKDAIVYEGGVGAEDDRYLFIKNDGSLYGAYNSDAFARYELKDPFITSFCQKPTKVIINGKEIELTAKIQIVDDRSMYPFRECLENMGATVLWDNANRIAIGEYKGTTIEFPIDKYEYWINGNKYEMDTKSFIDASLGRTYIPIRYAAEGLGFKVDWISGETENTIYIYEQ